MQAFDIIDKPVKGEEVFSFLVEVTLPGEDTSPGFLKVRETLTRIGIQSRRNAKELFQTCHILHSRGRYYIVHFKHMFLIDGGENNIAGGDIARMNRIIALLAEWGMVKVVKPEMITCPASSLHTIKIVPYADKHNWTLKAKYAVGRQPSERNAA